MSFWNISTFAIIAGALSLLLHICEAQKCVKDLTKVADGRKCRKACTSDDECRGELKRCHCDNVCGMSCFNPNAECPPPDEIENGAVTGDGYVYSNEVVYSCLDGYVLAGEAKRMCQSDKKWSGTIPTCEPGCDFPPRYSESFVTTLEKGFAVGRKLKYSCRFGFDLSGDNEVECLPNFKWTEPNFRCSKLTCGNPGVPDNGYIQPENFFFGSTITYHCNKGYMIDDSKNNVRKCLATGVWTGETRTCKKINCPPPAELENGFVTTSGDVNEFRTIVTYRCNAGFQLNGPNTGECNEEGEWGPVPTCTVDVNCNFDGFVNAFCGYTNEGEGKWERHFLQDGTLSGSPSYVLRASFTPAILRSPMIFRGIAHCFKFYYRIRTSSVKKDSLVISNTNGNEVLARILPREPKWRWVGRQVTVDFNPVFKSLQFDVTLKGDGTKIDLDDFSLVVNKCNDNCASTPCMNKGDCIDRINTYECICTKYFTGRNCEQRILCPKVEAPRHGSIQVSPDPTSFGVDTEILFSCDKGYRKSGFFQPLSCLENGEWSDTKRPYCRVIKCSLVRASNNVIMTISPNPNSLTIGTVAKFLCPIGEFLSNGPAAIVCNSQGEWSESRRPECKNKKIYILGCPIGYVRKDGGMLCYKIYTDEKTYREAREICSEDGARLATVQSEEKRKILDDMATKRRVYYIGLDDIGRDNVGWSSGENFVQLNSVSYTGNYKRRRKMNTNFRCGTFLSERDSVISTTSCSETFNFVCESFATNAMPVLTITSNEELDSVRGVYRPSPGIIYNSAHVYIQEKTNNYCLVRSKKQEKFGWRLSRFNATSLTPSDSFLIEVDSQEAVPENIKGLKEWRAGNGMSIEGDINVAFLPYDQWKHWTQWSECSHTCGNGTRTRNRRCGQKNGKTGHGDCRGLAGEIETCLVKKCVIGGRFTERL